jgi:hypothetical protein
MSAGLLIRAFAAMAKSGPKAATDGDIANGLISNSRVGPSNCFSGVTYFTDGTKFTCTNAGVYSEDRGSWLVSGSASDCYLEWEEDVGSPDTMQSPPTATPPRLQMSAGDIVFETNTIVTGTVLVDINISIYDAITGGNLLDSFQITLDAEET